MHYSRLFPEWATPHPVIIHVHFSSDVTVWQRRVLNRMVNTVVYTTCPKKLDTFIITA